MNRIPLYLTAAVIAVTASLLLVSIAAAFGADNRITFWIAGFAACWINRFVVDAYDIWQSALL